MKFISSSIEDSFYFIFAEGKFIRTRQKRKYSTRDDPIDHHANNFEREEYVEIDETLKNQLGTILTTLNYNGIGCFDLKYENNDLKRPKLLELNPRICGGMQKFDDLGEWTRDWALL